MRLIDADVLDFDGMSITQIVDAVQDAETVDAEPVTRCKDCVKRFNWNNGCGVCRMIGQNMNDTDFCSYGKRKEAT